MNNIEIVNPDNNGVIQLTASDAADLLRACSLYVSFIQRWHSDAHADALRTFDDCRQMDPDFDKYSALFLSAMCRSDNGYTADIAE